VRSLAARAAGALVILLGLAGTLAAQTTAKSSAFGESINLRLLPLLGSGIPIGSGPLPLVAGTAPQPFNRSGSLASITVATPATGRILAAGLLTVHASSGVPGTDSSAADATVANLALDVVQRLPLLTLGADVVRSTVALSGSCADGPVPVGTTSIVNARVGGLLGIGISVAASPAPNTVLLNAPGLRVVLNEQIAATEAGVRGLTVNAIHVSLNALPLAGLGLLSGDVVLSQSHAEIHCAEGSADLGVTNVGSPDPVSPGGVLTYSIGVANAGPDAAQQTILTDPLPAGVTLLAVSPSQGSCSGTTTLTCDLGTLAPGDQTFVTIAVSANQLGVLTNTASVASALPDPNPGDNQATAVNTVQSGGPAQ